MWIQIGMAFLSDLSHSESISKGLRPSINGSHLLDYIDFFSVADGLIVNLAPHPGSGYK